MIKIEQKEQCYISQQDQQIQTILNPESSFSAAIQSYDKWYKENKALIQKNENIAQKMQITKKYIIYEYYDQFYKEINIQAQQLKLGYQWYHYDEQNTYQEKQIFILEVLFDIKYIYDMQNNAIRTSMKYPIIKNKTIQDKCIENLKKFFEKNVELQDFKEINDNNFKTYHSGHQIQRYIGQNKQYVIIQQLISTCQPNDKIVQEKQNLQLYIKLDCELFQPQITEIVAINTWFNDYDGIIMVVHNQDIIIQLNENKIFQREQLLKWKILQKDTFEEVTIIVLERTDKIFQ